MMDDLLTVETSVATARGASIKFQQRVLRADKELVTAVALVAAIRDGRPARIPTIFAVSFRRPRDVRRRKGAGRGSAGERRTGRSAAGKSVVTISDMNELPCLLDPRGLPWRRLSSPERALIFCRGFAEGAPKFHAARGRIFSARARLGSAPDKKKASGATDNFLVS